MLQHLLGLWHEYWETKPLSCYKKERLIGCSFVTPNLNLKAKLPKCKCFLPACLTSPSACGPPLIKCIQNSRNGGGGSELRVALTARSRSLIALWRTSDGARNEKSTLLSISVAFFPVDIFGWKIPEKVDEISLHGVGGSHFPTRIQITNRRCSGSSECYTNE